LLRHPRWRVILQNRDDAEHLGASDAVVIPGSGVDLAEYAPAPEPAGIPLVVLPSRMLRDKGVHEFVEAARALKRAGVAARFALVGAPDPENPASIAEAHLNAWAREGAVEWWGWREDMAAVFRESAVVCLPSWREGLPKVLAEAAAAGRPIVTCDVPGCREVVRDGENGFLVPPRRPDALAVALGKLVQDAALRKALGEAGRRRAQAFSVETVVEQTLKVYRELL
jgi:glycosyltransferase involved in cell wall biosynthesis